MSEADYYPPGAYTDPNAPYNQVEPPEIEFDCCVSYTLERDSSLITDQVYMDEDGWTLCDDADLFDAYEYGRTSIPKLLKELVKYIDKELEGNVNAKRRKELSSMRESATGWKEVDMDIEIT